MDRVEVRLRLIEKVYSYGIPGGVDQILDILKPLEAWVFQQPRPDPGTRPDTRPRKTDTP